MPPQRVTTEVDPEAFFRKGESFYFTGAYLMSQGLALMGPTSFASITCMAFATEVYLKVLAQIEREENWLDTHNLRNLFHDLRPQTQREIRRQWLKDSGKMLKRDSAGPLPPGYKPAKTFEQALDLSAKAFVDWRYGTGGSHWYMNGLAGLARDRILLARPDWRPVAGSSLASLNPHPDFVKAKDYVTTSLPPLGFTKLKNQPPAIHLNIRRGSDPDEDGPNHFIKLS